MLGLDNNYQNIIWSHPEIDNENANYEIGDGDHSGQLSTKIISPTITIGLSDYWNMTITQTFGIRSMIWGKDWDSMHHRSENTTSNFKNAIGGVVGDSRLIFRYLILNDGAGPGRRLFLGFGMIRPSKNTLTSSPFFENSDETVEHRHFSISQGIYKSILETQYFIKSKSNPVFYGGTLTFELPFSKNEYGYEAPNLIDLSLSAMSKKSNLIKGSYSLSMLIRYSSEEYWNDIPTPNSESLIFIPGIGFLWNRDFGTVTINIQKPYIINGSINGTEGLAEEKTDVYQISISMRKVLKHSLKFLEK